MDTAVRIEPPSPPLTALLSAQRRVLEMAISREKIEVLLGALAAAGRDHIGGRSAVFLADDGG